jgi:hypothetical protein
MDLYVEHSTITPSRGLLSMTTDDEMDKPNLNLIPPRYSKKKPRVIQWFPIGSWKAPAILDGTLAGDVGFDPLGFSNSKNALYWMREAEIKHARLAMLAAVGWPLSEVWHNGFAKILGMDSILASEDRAPSLLNGGLSSDYVFDTLVVSIIFASLLEKKAMDTGIIFWNSKKPDNYVPGNLGFDPLSLYAKRNNNKLEMETAEIKNGRLAMVAITSYVIQEAVTGLPVVQNTPFLF